MSLANARITDQNHYMIEYLVIIVCRIDLIQAQHFHLHLNKKLKLSSCLVFIAIMIY